MSKLPRWIKMHIIAIVVIALFCVVALAAYVVAFEFIYKDKIYPGVRIGALEFGGLDKDKVQIILSEMQFQLDEFGLRFSFQDSEGVVRNTQLHPTIITSGTGDSIDLIRINAEHTLNELFLYGRSGNYLKKFKDRILALTQGRKLAAKLDVDGAGLSELLVKNLSKYISEAANASILFEDAQKLGKPSLVAHKEGSTLLYEDALNRIIEHSQVFNVDPVTIERAVDKPTITLERASSTFAKMEDALKGNIVLIYKPDAQTATSTWEIEPLVFAQWLEFQHDMEGNVVFGLDQSKTLAYMDEKIRPDVDVAMQNAKFALANGKVVEFVESHDGVNLEGEFTYDFINKEMYERLGRSSEYEPRPIRLVVSTSSPQVKTADVNNLGITEVVGSGFSSYKGSPGNRIKNIRNAVNKLNGILIPPGETFSLVSALKPFTLENGYLKELVIKGDEIIPEIAGGLCQIGTTVFRTAMGAGTEITERRNHSLVVTYYNDPSNGLPGTDATIYSPNPDFKFTNDYDSHLLLKTYMDENKSELRFTLWGTSDGRKGYYTPPVVTKWRGVGPDRTIKTTKLKPGQIDCQSAHPGADASFVYKIDRPDGTTDDREFVSHYRSLPKICLVGVTQEELDAEALIAKEQAIILGQVAGEGDKKESKYSAEDLFPKDE